MGEQKAVAPTPRELRDLIEITSDLKQAVAGKSKDRAASLLEQLGGAWARGNALQLKISSIADYPHRERLLVELADGLNDAMTARSGALSLIGVLGTPR